MKFEVYFDIRKRRNLVEVEIMFGKNTMFGSYDVNGFNTLIDSIYFTLKLEELNNLEKEVKKRIEKKFPNIKDYTIEVDY